MTTTYTADQIAFSFDGSRRWHGRDIERVYLSAQDDIAPMIGLEIDTYRNGGIKTAWLNGDKISNAAALRALKGDVYWQDGTIHITGALADHDTAIRAAIAGKVAA